jgi:hypothetical protein
MSAGLGVAEVQGELDDREGLLHSLGAVFRGLPPDVALEPETDT